MTPPILREAVKVAAATWLARLFAGWDACARDRGSRALP